MQFLFENDSEIGWRFKSASFADLRNTIVGVFQQVHSARYFDFGKKFNKSKTRTVFELMG